jgi:hypothetical protein
MSVVKCTIPTTEHRSDHRAIETISDAATPERVAEARLLFSRRQKRACSHKSEPEIARINGYLHQVRETDSDYCVRG